MSVILSVKNLTVGYPRKAVLAKINFEIMDGDFLALAGPNGAGKTTLVRTILGLVKAQKGEVFLLGENLANFKAWKNLGYLPQKMAVYNPIFPITVKEVIRLGLLPEKKFPRIFNINDEVKVARVLNIFKLTNLKDKALTELSGGEQQRVFLAKALVTKPKILILDEPSTSLDPKARGEFFDSLHKLNHEEKVTIIFITHDLEQISKFANKLLYLDQKLVYFGAFKGFNKFGAEGEKDHD